MFEQLEYYMQRGYQICFDHSGMRAWHVFSSPTPLLYKGGNTDAMFAALDEHYWTVKDDYE